MERYGICIEEKVEIRLIIPDNKIVGTSTESFIGSFTNFYRELSGDKYWLEYDSRIINENLPQALWLLTLRIRLSLKQKVMDWINDAGKERGIVFDESLPVDD